jgi:hypothetical protein
MNTQLTSKELRIQEYNKNPNKCKFCGKIFPYEKRKNNFCNSSCSGHYYKHKSHSPEVCMKISNTLKNYYMSKNDKHYKNEESFCLNCNSKIKFGRKFCNSKCQGEYGTKQKFIKIEESGYFPANKNTNDTDLRNVRKYLIAKYGHKCSICGLSEWMGQPIPLVADHIDGDTTNHKVENFRMVCENCNAQLPTYKSKNTHGRVWRKKYYEKYYHDEEK